MVKFTLTPELFAEFSAVLAAAAGLHFDSSKLTTLQGHLRDRARARHQADLLEYLRLLHDPQEGPAEVQRLIETVTIHETSFFRNQEHFKALNTIVIPALTGTPRTGPHARTLRLWSAGCATGEEPYSLAIACLEHPALAGWRIEILATDISRAVLEIAREGLYSGDALRYVTPDRVRRWFTNVDEPAPAHPPAGATHVAGAKGGPQRPGTGQIAALARGSRRRFRVNDEVRRLVTFAPHNLSQVPYDPEVYSGRDLLVCENVLIYTSATLAQQVITEFYRCLHPGGYLFLGYSETLWRLSNAFQMVTTPSTFFYQRPVSGPARSSLPIPATPPRPAGRAQPDTAGKPPPAPQRFYISASPGAPPAAPRAKQPAAPAAPPPARPADSQPPPPARPAAPPPQSAVRSPQSATAVPDPATAAWQETQAGLGLLEQGRYDEAQTAFERALASYPGAVEALVGLAQIHANQGRPQAAIAACRRAINLDSLCENAHLLLALIYRQQHHLGSAIDHLAKVIYINVESVPGHFHLAELHRSQGDWTAAAREYRRTLWALDRTHEGDTISGLPVAMIRKACEQQLRRIHEQHSAGR